AVEHRNAIAVTADDPQRAVGRLVIDDDDLCHRPRLGEDGIDGPADEALAVPHRDDDRDRFAHAALRPCSVTAVQMPETTSRSASSMPPATAPARKRMTATSAAAAGPAGIATSAAATASANPRNSMALRRSKMRMPI